jgi:hypothetical protein
MLSPSSSLFTAIKLKANKISNMKATLTLLPKNTDIKVTEFSKVYHHKSFQDCKLSGHLVALPHEKFMHPSYCFFIAGN